MESKRPLVLAGYGIRQSSSGEFFKQFINKYNLPFVSTYGARDYVNDDNLFSIGAVGQRGSRAGNFALQNADLLIILGSSLNASVLGYDPKQFSPYSYKIHVDIDSSELNKEIVKTDLENELLYLKGSIPGSKNAEVIVRGSVKNIKKSTINEKIKKAEEAKKTPDKKKK